MSDPLPHYREVVARALIGRSVTGTAREHGLPKDSIRYVLQGRDPSLSRADEICRVLGVTYTLGLPGGAVVDRYPDPDPAVERGVQFTGKVPLRDIQLAELLARLADYWEVLEVAERERLATGFRAVLDLLRVPGASELRRELEYLGWRLVEGPPGDGSS